MIKYLFVNTITTFSLILGLIAIFFVIDGSFYLSFGFALLALVCDSLDGYFARLLRAESYFGSIFDTIADIVVYLSYPAVVLYFYFGLNNFIGLLFIMIFIISGIYRLIKFTNNSFTVEGVKKYYNGMPVFFSHIMIMIMVLFSLFNKNLLQITGSLLLVMISIMMITKYKFRKPDGGVLIISLIVILSLSICMFNL
ncbi:MAG: CDP-alcohol phosphatidyltransferase family protein [Candidatus Pacebacteria bacterium]|nr:CDP-alcohol phosphatidyltransferase family protein [Candidatus Paceibacterota bacterium]